MKEMKHNRRKFLQMAGLGSMGLSLPLSWPEAADNLQKNTHSMVYIGTYTKDNSEGIYLCKLDPATGGLSRVSAAQVKDNPSYLALDPQRRYLYAVNETGEYQGKKSGAVSAFAVDQKTGGLRFINQRASQGGAPCYITVDKSGKNVLVANYLGGNVTLFPVGTDGGLGEVSDMHQHQGSSVNEKRQEEPHAHCIVLDPANKFAFAADLGTDKIMIYRFDATKSKLTPNQPAFVATKPGAGPRHLTFHPNGKHAFVINELNSTLTAYSYDASKGSLTEIQTVSTLPQGFSGENYCADIHISPDGKFIYGSNRGHDSIVVLGFDQSNGKLTYIQNVSTGGKWPRNFALDPSGKFLLVANQNTNNIVSFKIDSKTGKLASTGQITEVPSPVCLLMVPAFG
jgi:6-phosphogluconolactonase